MTVTAQPAVDTGQHMYCEGQWVPVLLVHGEPVCGRCGESVRGWLVDVSNGGKGGAW